MKNLVFGVVFLCLPLINPIYGQQVIKGSVTSKSNETVDFVNVFMFDADSSLVASTFTDLKGEFQFSSNIKTKVYFAVNGLGFKDLKTRVFDKEDFKKPILIVIESASQQLSEVTIKSSVPAIQQKIDRMVLNVSAIQASGNSAIDLLERSPGIMVNKSTNSISMMGKSGVFIMINDKLTNMPTDAAIAMLEGMSATQLSKIELITTPPANLDAQGNAGYINIVTKDNPDLGWLGNYVLTAGYGDGPVGLASMNVQYRRNKLAKTKVEK